MTGGPTDDDHERPDPDPSDQGSDDTGKGDTSADAALAELNGASQRVRDQWRARRALNLKVAGYTWAEVADHEDCHYYDATTARTAVQRLMREYPREDAAEYRDVQLARYERLLRAVWPAAVGEDSDGNELVRLDKDGNPKRKGPDLWAVDRAMRLVENIAELSGAKHAGPSQLEEDPDAGRTNVPGRSLADVLGVEPAKARLVARTLAEVLPPRQEPMVIDPDQPSGNV